MSIKYPIKIVWDFDEELYCCFIDGIANIVGYGETESEAIEDFEKNYLRLTCEKL